MIFCRIAKILGRSIDYNRPPKTSSMSPVSLTCCTRSTSIKKIVVWFGHERILEAKTVRISNKQGHRKPVGYFRRLVEPCHKAKFQKVLRFGSPDRPCSGTPYLTVFFPSFLGLFFHIFRPFLMSATFYCTFFRCCKLMCRGVSGCESVVCSCYYQWRIQGEGGGLMGLQPHHHPTQIRDNVIPV